MPLQCRLVVLTFLFLSGHWRSRGAAGPISINSRLVLKSSMMLSDQVLDQVLSQRERLGSSGMEFCSWLLIHCQWSDCFGLSGCETSNFDMMRPSKSLGPFFWMPKKWTWHRTRGHLAKERNCAYFLTRNEWGLRRCSFFWFFHYECI